MPNNLLRQPNFAAAVTLVWLLVALVLLLQYWNQTAETLLDTDDAMRLAQLHDWLGRGFLSGWFDLHQARMQPPEGYDTHWSRLIDAGLAGTLWFFGLFFDGALAERLMRTAWPALWLLLLSMLGALIFGVCYHYLIISPDHVAHLPPGDARGMFRITAVLLVATEAVGVVVSAASLLRLQRHKKTQEAQA